jgi:tetratricopeptide (TPR) repeat protein
VHRLAGRYEEALADLDRAIELSPSDSAWDHYEAGLTLLSLGRTEEAKRRIHTAIEGEREDLRKDAGDITAAFNIAVYLVALGDVEGGRAQLERTLRPGVSGKAVRDAIDDFRELAEFGGRDLSGFTDLLTSYL